MRRYAIGCVRRVHNISGKKLGAIEAYLIYDLHSDKEDKTEILSIKQIKEIFQDGGTVIGLKFQNNRVIPNNYCMYNARRLDELNGAGEPITPPDERKEVLLGYKGYGEKTTYRVVKSTRVTRDLTYDEICSLAKEGKVIGTGVGTDENGEEKLKIFRDCDVRIYK